MTKFERARFDNHDEVWELLPWYVNGSLDAGELGLVERHAQVCITCRSELAAQRGFAAEIADVDVQVLAATSAYRDLDRRIKAADVAWISPQQVVQGILENARTWTRQLRIPVALATVTVCFSVAFAITSALEWSKATGGDYRTLTAPNGLAVPGSRDVRVVFSDRLTLDELQDTLAPIHASVVEGPSPHGVFLIRIGDSNTSFGDLVAAVSALRADNNVIFAEPAFAMPALQQGMVE